jgi:hypothetical protein
MRAIVELARLRRLWRHLLIRDDPTGEFGPGKRSLQRLRLIPRRAHQKIGLSRSVEKSLPNSAPTA